MAKNKSQRVAATNDYEQIQRHIQKAKGNPNKNVHQKKNGSDYKTDEREAAKRAASQPKKKTPLWLKIAIGAGFVALLVLVILINTSMKGNPVIVSTTALVTGITCLLVYYSRRYLDRPVTTGYRIISIILVILGIVYGLMGLYGLFNLAA